MASSITDVGGTAGSNAKWNGASFRAYLAASLSGVTGDGTLWTIPFDTVQWNYGFTFSAGTLTTATRGVYRVGACVYLNGGSGQYYGCLRIVTTGTYAGARQTSKDGNPASGSWCLQLDDLVQMDQGSTLTVTCQILGSTKNLNCAGTTPEYTWLSAQMVG